MREKIGAIDAWAACMGKNPEYQWPEEFRHIFRAYGTLEKLEGGYSAEEMIDDMIESKKALADAVVGSGEKWMTEMSTDELRKAVSLRTF